MPSLYREGDNSGDSGAMFNIYRQNPETYEVEWEHQPEKPRLGWGVQVGSFSARSFSHQDYWTTTPITEIIEERDGYMKFKTRSGSTYIWEA